MSTIIYTSPIFGPVHSRRLGLSLGINLMPGDGKICTFDCIYCECGFNKDHRPRQPRPTRETVSNALETKLRQMAAEGRLPDVLTFAGNGEPTAHPQFADIIGDTIALRDRYCPAAKVSVLSNSTFIHREAVREALLRVDNNILKLDTVNPDYINKVDRPTGQYDVARVVADMKLFGGDYGSLFRESLKGDKDCGGVVVVPFLSGEPVTGVSDAMLKVVRQPESAFTLANFFRAQIYSAFVSLKIGMDILLREGVEIRSLVGHGGIFRDKGIAQQYLADALRTPVTCMSTASEGGPWGMAVLAAYAASGAQEPLEDYLAKKVFAGAASETLAPTAEGSAGFDRYTANFKAAIAK